MKVIYDPQIFASQEFGGISRYFCALAGQLQKFPDIEVRIVAPLYGNRHLKELRSGITLGQYVPRLPKTGRFIRTLSAKLFRPIASLIRPDIVHETYYSTSPTCGGNMPRALTVYDMIHERCPESFSEADPTAHIKAIAVRRADHIFCISESTRRDLLEIHRLPENRVSVTYLGYDTLPLTALTAADLVGEAPYLLHVGGRHGYKNFEGLLRAFSASAWLRNNLRLVCFGSSGFSSDERRLIAALGITQSQVIQLGGGDDRLAALYKDAAAFIYPSKYEGFGIPPLEAMSLDCPVICSNVSSIPEVVGEAGEYFDPQDVESIRASLERVLQSSARRKELIALGRLRRELFSWSRCAKETHNVYSNLIG
jgi:glycosyltransferase involved in cell wall biosynthesis